MAVAPDAPEHKKYPADFVKRVLVEFPDWHGLECWIENGAEEVGTFLEHNSESELGPGLIIEFIDKGLVDVLREKAVRLKRRRELFAEWKKLWGQVS